MKSLIHIPNMRLITDRSAARVGQLVCFVASIVVFMCAVLKLCSLQLSEGQLIIGLLAAGSCMLLIAVIALLLPLAVRAESDLTKHQG
jgi:hypothetical protein